MSIIIDIIPSKSFAHRAYLCSALSDHPSQVICRFTSEDIEATRECVRALREGESVMECGESGSTLRFLLPVMGALGRRGVFMTKGRLADRPLSPLREELERHGCRLSPPGTSPVTIEGQLTSGEYVIPGNVSSQFISGLLTALPLLKGNSTVVIEGPLESSAYVDITTEVLMKFGIGWVKKITGDGCCYEIPGGQMYQGPRQYVVEGDWSNAAFWLCAGVIGKEPVTVRGLRKDSLQGDRRIVDILRDFGAELRWDGSEITAFPSRLTGTEVDVSGVPDLAPVIALAASVASGRTDINNAGRLRLKESDRLTSVAESMNALGARVREKKDKLVIRGSGGASLIGGYVKSWGDHRIVMMEAMASLVCEHKVIIRGKEAVSKSWPVFFQELERAGLAGNLK